MSHISITIFFKIIAIWCYFPPYRAISVCGVNLCVFLCVLWSTESEETEPGGNETVSQVLFLLSMLSPWAKNCNRKRWLHHYCTGTTCTPRQDLDQFHNLDLVMIINFLIIFMILFKLLWREFLQIGTNIHLDSRYWLEFDRFSIKWGQLAWSTCRVSPP